MKIRRRASQGGTTAAGGLEIAGRSSRREMKPVAVRVAFNVYFEGRRRGQAETVLSDPSTRTSLRVIARLL